MIEIGDSPLDGGIEREVLLLRENGVETFESCQGGPGHAFPEPTIRFFGTAAAGWHALSVAKDHALNVRALRRVWDMTDDEPTGPQWEIVLRGPEGAWWLHQSPVVEDASWIAERKRLAGVQ